MQSKFSDKLAPLVPFFISCTLPIGATILDILRYGLPMSLASALTVQTIQPLHWIIASVPLLFLLFRPTRVQTITGRADSRTGTQGTKQNATTTKMTQLVTELKNELAKQRRTEETLRASEEFYRNLVENANDGIAVVSVDGNVTSVNRGFERMLGRNREEIVGKHYATMLSASSASAMEDRLLRFHSGDKPGSLFELELLHQNGTLITAEARVRPITDKNSVTIGFQGVYRDLAKRAAMKKDEVISATAVTTPAPMPWEQQPAQLQEETPSSQLDEPYEFKIFSTSDESPDLQSTMPSSDASRTETEESIPAPSIAEATDLLRKDNRSAKVVPFPPLSTTEVETPSSAQIFNLEETLARVDGDRELLCELADVFLEQYPGLLTMMQDAFAQETVDPLIYAAHTLKGSIANFAAPDAQHAVTRLEKIARQGDLVLAKPALTEFEAELDRLIPLLKKLRVEIAA